MVDDKRNTASSVTGTPPEGELDNASPTPVDRARRHRFAFMVVSFSLATSAIFTVMAAVGFMSPVFMGLVDAYVSAQLTLAGAVSMSYIAGSVVDYTLGPRPKIMSKG